MFIYTNITLFRNFKNVEDALEYLFQLPDEPSDTGIDIYLEPPVDEDDSDIDDPSEDIVDVGVEDISLLGPRQLARPAHVALSNRHTRPVATSSQSKSFEGMSM